MTRRTSRRRSSRHLRRNSKTGKIQIFLRNKLLDYAPDFESTLAAKRWLRDRDPGGPSKWRKEVAQYKNGDGLRTSYYGGPGNMWEVRQVAGLAKNSRRRRSRGRR